MHKSCIGKMDMLGLQQICCKKLFFMSKRTTRKIKLQPKARTLTRSQKIVPELRINGVWLQRSGFVAGQTVEITVQENQLIIKPTS